MEFCHWLHGELERLLYYFKVQQTISFSLGNIKYCTQDIKICLTVKKGPKLLFLMPKPFQCLQPASQLHHFSRTAVEEQLEKTP